MNKTTKTVLIILGSILLLCACTTAALLGTGLWSFGRVVQFLDNSTTEDPQEVAQLASEIADFDIPAGFDTQYGIKISTFSMVQYTTRSEETYIFLTQFPAGTSINVDEMIRQIRNNSRNPNSPWYNVDTQLVEKSLTANVVFGIYYGISNNKGAYWDITSARMDLGFEPEDDGSTR